MYRRFKPVPHRFCQQALCRVPPSPGLMNDLRQRFQDLMTEKRLPPSTTFQQFFDIWVSGRRGENVGGLDDGKLVPTSSAAVQLIDRPNKVLKGVVQTVVLLVDFPDQPHAVENTTLHYQQMLFGVDGAFRTGSMRDYYRKVSNFKAGTKPAGIDVQGQVFGWFRMPQPMSFYTNNNSGFGNDAPRNAQGMARDAIAAAMAAGVNFKPFDALGEKTVTALFIIHAGHGAEETGLKTDIWSHKWTVPGSPQVAPGLTVQTYLTVPEDCKVGVCAHEWGHLAARWADYYDTGDNDNTTSNGLGLYCLMAAGSWGDNGTTPVLPNAMLRMFHGWAPVQLVTKTTTGITLTPAAEGGGSVVIQNKKTMSDKQYVIVEYRRRQFQDAFLPDEGLAIFVVDEAIEDVNDENNLAIELLQADNKRELAGVFHTGNAGDSGDLFPFGNKRTLGKGTKPALKLPDGKWTGLTIKVKGKPGDATMGLDVTFAP